MKKYFLLSFYLLCSFLICKAQPTVDGDLSDSDYISVATKQNSNSGFGSSIDIQEIVYYADNTNSRLYIGVKGKLNTSNNDGIGLFLNFTGLTGVAAGNPLGFPGAGHFMDGQGGGSNDDFKADFEVDYMFAVNASGGSNAFLDAAKITGGNTADFVGTAPNLTGGTVTDNDLFGTGSTATYAFNNGGSANQGLEMVIDYAALGISSVGFLEAFAVVVSSTGFFSDVTIPGNETGGNQGDNVCYPDRPGGPYNSGNLPLPVELTYFNGKVKSEHIHLSWATASEIENSHFEIERSQNAKTWQVIGKIYGKGNSLEQTTYQFIDRLPLKDNNYYRLKQVDFDGSHEFSNVVTIALSQKKSEDISVYPTLVKNELTIENGFGEARLYNFSGQLMSVFQISEERFLLNTSNLPNGRYTLSVLGTNGGTASISFLVW